MRKPMLFPLFLVAGIVVLAAGCQAIQSVEPLQTETPDEEQRQDAVSAAPMMGSERGTTEVGPAASDEAAADSNTGCPIFDFRTAVASNTLEAVTGNSDPLALLLASSSVCPADVFALRELLTRDGAQFSTTMVANRGFHNPALGSFSLFEVVEGTLSTIGAVLGPGDFFFGHFTARNGPELVAAQNPGGFGLMVELIAWDTEKGVYNFYELRDAGTEGFWFYNGDSFDILKDIELLHRQPEPQVPPFAGRLRCSECHMSGGPIMKELAVPHNDWWTVERGLNFGGRTPDAGLGSIVGENFAGLSDASDLADSVAHGLEKLQASEAFQAQASSLSLQERLRPLFCPLELNLETDLHALDDNAETVEIPTAFFVDPRLAQGTMVIEKSLYVAALEQWNAQFPEIDRRDGDRAWETPVKATSDIMAVQTLVDQGVIDEEFVSDVLVVDMTNPALSGERCELLRLLPEGIEEDGWQESFAAALGAAAGENVAAAQLHDNLTNPEQNLQAHQGLAQRLLATCQERVTDAAAAEVVAELFGLLAQKRAEVFASEISTGPHGGILEPGFRVIFPVVSPQPDPGTMILNEACQVVAVNGQ